MERNHIAVPGLLFLLALGVWVGAQAQDFEVRLHRPARVGDRYGIACSALVALTETTTKDGKQTHGKDNQRSSLVFDAQVLVTGVGPHGQETSVELTVERLVAWQGERETVLLPPGKVLVAGVGAKEGGFRLKDGSQLSGEALEALEVIAPKGPVGPEADTAWGTKERQPVNGEWPANLASLAPVLDALHVAVPLPDGKLPAKGRLCGIETAGGIECLNVSASVTAPNTRASFPQTAHVARNDVTVAIGGLFPVDVNQGQQSRFFSVTAYSLATLFYSDGTESQKKETTLTCSVVVRRTPARP